MDHWGSPGLRFELPFTSDDAEVEEVGNRVWIQMEQGSSNTNAESRTHVLRLVKKNTGQGDKGPEFEVQLCLCY